MNGNTANDQLNETILSLELKQAEELFLLKEQFHITYQSLKPINLLKNAIQDIVHSPEIKGDVTNNLIGLSSGFLVKKVLVGASHNPIKILVGVVLQLVVANVVSKHSEGLKNAGINLLSYFLRKGKKVKKLKEISY